MPDKLNFGVCVFCGLLDSDAQSDRGLAYHVTCLTCPQCHADDFQAYILTTRPYRTRCLNCLCRYEPGNPPRNWPNAVDFYKAEEPV